MNMTFAEIQKVLKESIEELFKNDRCLIENDVSERAITHKLAEYLQKRIPALHVDCEYNRDATQGRNAPKQINLLRGKTQAIRKDCLDESEWLAVSTYPDVIVHRRLTNDFNLLVIEVKKLNSRVPHEHDIHKLKAFTENTDQNSYRFRYGVFIVLVTGAGISEPQTQIRWFSDGKEINNDN